MIHLSARINSSGACTLVLLLAALTTLTGCMLPGFVAGVIPTTIHPLYVPEDVNTLILVDDPDRHLNSRQDAALVAETIAITLRREGVITHFVEPREAEALRLNNPDFDSWSLTRIGRELKAQQVIHVRITALVLQGQNGYVQPIATGEVKVFDPTTQQRLFPNPNRSADSPGQPVTARHFFQDSSTASGTDPNTLRRQIALKLAETTAKLFYKHLQEDDSTSGDRL